MWNKINQIRIKPAWTRKDIEDLVFFIRHVTELNTNVSKELGDALASLDRLHQRLDFYRRTTSLKVITGEGKDKDKS